MLWVNFFANNSIEGNVFFKKNVLHRNIIFNISSIAPPWGQNLYPEDHEIYNFGRHLPALWYLANIVFITVEEYG
jgi:hypothetical protein